MVMAAAVMAATMVPGISTLRRHGPPSATAVIAASITAMIIRRTGTGADACHHGMRLATIEEIGSAAAMIATTRVTASTRGVPDLRRSANVAVAYSSS